MINLQYLNKYKPHFIKDFTEQQQKLANQLYSYVANFDNSSIKSTNLILGETGSGKSYFIDQIFDSINIPFYGQLKTFNLDKMKKYLKDNNNELKSKLSRENQIKEYLKTKCINNSILDFLQPNYKKANIILYFDEHDNQIVTPKIKELLRDIINTNNKYKICPIIITFIDSMDQYLKQYKNNTNTFYYNQPSNTEIKNYINKILTNENIQIKDKDLNVFSDLCNNNYGLANNNIIELLTNYLTTETISKFKIKKYITTKSINNFIQNKNKNIYIYDDIIDSCKKSLYNELTINEMMQLFYKEKINYPNNICHYVLNNCKNNKAFVEISKILAFSDKINENIYKDQKWMLSKYYGFLSCVNLSSTFAHAHKNYKFTKIPYSIHKNYKEHNFTFYFKLNSLNGINNILLSQMIIELIIHKDKKTIENFIDTYKLDYKDIIYILNINKMNKKDITKIKNINFIKNYIENKEKNKYNVSLIKHDN